MRARTINGPQLYDIPAKLVHETGAAWKLDVGLPDPIWVPKASVEFDGVTLTIPERLAIEKGLDNLT